MLLTNLKEAFLSGLDKIKDVFFLAEEKALESLPEPYIPPVEEIAAIPEKLRERVTKALDGQGGDAGQLRDPINVKAETNDVPKPIQGQTASASSFSPLPLERQNNNDNGQSNEKGREETLREKATKKLHGPDSNPTLLGDPISLKAEQSDHVSKSEDGARQKRDSKL